jgi:hypothetical protein
MVKILYNKNECPLSIRAYDSFAGSGLIPITLYKVLQLAVF